MERLLAEVLKDRNRLAALKRTKLMDSPSDPQFDRLTRLTIKILKVPVALVTLVDDERQFFKSCIGLPEPWQTQRHTGLNHSFCQHVVHTGEPFIVTDARQHPLVKDNLAIRDLGVIAYLGIPLLSGDGQVLGSFCAIDSVPRAWSNDDIYVMRELAQSVVTEIELRIESAEHAIDSEQLKKTNQKLEAANRELEAFAASVSHDLRAPLRAISGFAEILEQSHADTLGTEGKKHLDHITSGVKKMDELITDLLKFSNSTSKPMHATEIDLQALAREAWNEVSPALQGRKINFSLQAIPPARGDRSMLYQVFLNLLSNAIKFTRRKPDAAIEVGSEQRGDETVYFIRDNGAGFDMTHAAKLFCVFHRLHTQSDFEGTGIGLATVARIISRHGGRIWADAQVGKGATFFFVLPK